MPRLVAIPTPIAQRSALARFRKGSQPTAPVRIVVRAGCWSGHDSIGVSVVAALVCVARCSVARGTARHAGCAAARASPAAEVRTGGDGTARRCSHGRSCRRAQATVVAYCVGGAEPCGWSRGPTCLNDRSDVSGLVEAESVLAVASVAESVASQCRSGGCRAWMLSAGIHTPARDRRGSLR